MDIKNALSIIDSLREGWYNPPRKYYQNKDDFKWQSYRRSAIKEIEMFLLSNQHEDPISTIDIFRNQVDLFSCRAKNENTKFMFSVYYDVATDVLDILLNIK